jgi:hypothetical protein
MASLTIGRPGRGNQYAERDPGEGRRPLAAAARPVCECLEGRRLLAAQFYVSPSGSDANAGTTAAKPWRTIQRAANAGAVPAGSTVHVAAGQYNEHVTVRVSGSAAGGYVTFQAEGNAIIDGQKAAGKHLLDLSNRSYLKVVGFELRNGLGTNSDDASAVRVEGRGDHIEVRNNRIHDMLGRNAMALTFYGVDATSGIHDLVVDNNEIYNNKPATSETVTFNGNVYNFRATNNRVHDNNNIGIDVIGGEGVCAVPAKDQARNGVIANNRVWNNTGPDGFAAGIYVDGGRDVVIERNRVWGCNVGVEVGAENAGRTASNVTVRSNLLYLNDKAGLAFGGYESGVGRTVNSRFTNNTLYRNGETTKPGQGYGQIWVQWAKDCVVQNNVAYAGSGKRLAFFEDGGQTNVKLDYNVYYRAGGTGPLFTYDGDGDFDSLAAYRAFRGQDPHSKFADPKLASAPGGDFHLLTGSAAVNAGNPSYAAASGELDVYGGSRLLGGRVDAGADELK